MISNNTKGNPNHDENGRFASSSNNGGGGGPTSSSPTPPVPPDNGGDKSNGNFTPSVSVEEKIKQMGFGPSENSNPKKIENEYGSVEILADDLSDEENWSSDFIKLNFRTLITPTWGEDEGGEELDVNEDYYITLDDLASRMDIGEDIYGNPQKLKEYIENNTEEIMWNFMNDALEQYGEKQHEMYMDY